MSLLRKIVSLVAIGLVGALLFPRLLNWSSKSYRFNEKDESLFLMDIEALGIRLPRTYSAKRVLYWDDGVEPTRRVYTVFSKDRFELKDPIHLREGTVKYYEAIGKIEEEFGDIDKDELYLESVTGRDGRYDLFVARQPDGSKCIFEVTKTGAG